MRHVESNPPFSSSNERDFARASEHCVGGASVLSAIGANANGLSELTPRQGGFVLVVDIGGTGIKMLCVDAQGRPVNRRLRRLTPHPASPARLLSVVREMMRLQPVFEKMSVGFPGVVRAGVVQTAPHLNGELWRGHNLEISLSKLSGVPVKVVNDADLQGYGVILGQGVELVLTLGTGLGSALYSDGVLVPNFELGHHPFRKQKTYEERISDLELRRIGKKRWNRRVLEMVEQIAPIWNYDRLYLGGGNARKLQLPLPRNVSIFDNVAGLRGGARLWRMSIEPPNLRAPLSAPAVWRASPG